MAIIRKILALKPYCNYDQTRNHQGRPLQGLNTKSSKLADKQRSTMQIEIPDAQPNRLVEAQTTTAEQSHNQRILRWQMGTNSMLFCVAQNNRYSSRTLRTDNFVHSIQKSLRNDVLSNRIKNIRSSKQLDKDSKNVRLYVVKHDAKQLKCCVSTNSIYIICLLIM